MQTKMGTIMITFILALYFQINIVSAEYKSFSMTQEKGKVVFDTIKYIRCGHGYSDLLCLFSSLNIDNKDICMEDETEVNDVPFDTEKIAMDYHKKQLSKNDYILEDTNFFDMEEEQEVEDIPFDTKNVYYSIILDNNEYFMEEEAEVDDIPFNTREVYEKCMNI